MTTYVWELSFTFTPKEASLLKELCIYLLATYDRELEHNKETTFNYRIEDLYELYNNLDFQKEESITFSGGMESLTLYDELQKICVVPTKKQKISKNKINRTTKNIGYFSILSSYNTSVISSLQTKLKQKNKVLVLVSTSWPCQKAVQYIINLRKENDEENKIFEEDNFPAFLK